MDLYIPDESPSNIGKNTCDYEAMTNHAFKPPEPVECDCDAMNQHTNPHNCDTVYMKRKPMNMLFLTFNALIDYELFLD